MDAHLFLQTIKNADLQAGELAGAIFSKYGTPSNQSLAALAADALAALEKEPGYGRAFVQGALMMATAGGGNRLLSYTRRVHKAAETGPALGRIAADAAWPVMLAPKNGLKDSFDSAFETARQKATFVLADLFKVNTRLLEQKQPAASQAYMDLLHRIFSQDLTYEGIRLTTRLLTSCVPLLSFARRPYQLRQAVRVAGHDVSLLDDYFSGLSKKAGLLSEKRLHQFVDQGLAREAGPKTGRFLSLTSETGKKAVKELLSSVAFSQVSLRINRYLRARMGRGLKAAALSQLPRRFSAPPAGYQIFSGANTIYLPDEMDRFEDPAKNRDLFMVLARLEACVHEFETHSFDIHRFYAKTKSRRVLGAVCGKTGIAPDLDVFFTAMDHPFLARDLFLVFEHGRLRLLMGAAYPGLGRKAAAILGQEAEIIKKQAAGRHFLFPAYVHLAAGVTDKNRAFFLDQWAKRLEAAVQADPTVDSAALLTLQCHDALLTAGDAGPEPEAYQGLTPLFSRGFWPDLTLAGAKETDLLARRIQDRLKAAGLSAFRTQILPLLGASDRRAAMEEIQKTAVPLDMTTMGEGPAALPGKPDLSDLLQKQFVQTDPPKPWRARLPGTRNGMPEPGNTWRTMCGWWSGTPRRETRRITGSFWKKTRGWSGASAGPLSVCGPRA